MFISPILQQIADRFLAEKDEDGLVKAMATLIRSQNRLWAYRHLSKPVAACLWDTPKTAGNIYQSPNLSLREVPPIVYSEALSELRQIVPEKDE